MWKFGVACWIARNEFVYGSTEQEKIDKKNNATNLEIKYMYLLDRGKISDDDNHLFDMQLAERLEQNLEQKQLWIASVKAATLARSRDERKDPNNLSHQVDQQAMDEIPPPLQILDGRRPRVRLRS